MSRRHDGVGAGAIIAALPPASTRTAEAAAAEVLWHACRPQAGELIRNCFSGRELRAAGYPADLALAAVHDAQDTVPLLMGLSFTNGARPPQQA